MIVKNFLLLIIISQLQFPQKAFWEKTNLPSKTNVTTFGFNSKNEIYIGTNGKGIFRSNDKGKTWKNDKLSWGDVDCILVTKDDNLFIGLSMPSGRNYVHDDHPYGIYYVEDDSSVTKKSFSSLYVWSMTTDSVGNVFASTDNMYDYPDVAKLPTGKKNG